MIHLSKSLSYYKRSDVRERISENAESREVAARYNDKFGKRPDAINYPAEVTDFAKKGVSSFHVSEERWLNPLLITTEMSRKELDDLRVGWDLILDVDCFNFRISKTITALLIDSLKEHGIKSITVKFSGNKGFHIGVPFEAFPEKVAGKKTKDMFPEGPKRIAEYLIDRIKRKIKLEGDSVKFGDKEKIKVETIRMLIGSDSIEVFNADKKNPMMITFNPEAIMKLDTLLISTRHLYRMAYSMHEKSGLVSVPIELDEVMNFDKEKAKPENVKADKKFLNAEKAVNGEAASLFIQAFDFEPKKNENTIEKPKDYEIPEEAIPEKFFPPCIQKLFMGVEDGRKRALFILINFLSTAGWGYDAIEERLNEWNKQNKEPISQTYLNGQIRYSKQHRKKVPPPNCNNKAYYADMGVKCSEDICSRCKNPIIYAKKASSTEKD